MNEIENAIENIDKFKHFADLVESPEEYFQHMQGHHKELSLVLTVFDVAECHKEIKEALEKQIPKKPIRVSNNRTDGCPICKTEYYERFKHCPECGIKLDWSVESFEI